MYKPDLDQPAAERKRILSESVQMAVMHAVEGDIAEFGIARGHSIEVIAATMAQCDAVTERLKMPIKNLHAFDSFQGLPQTTLPGDVDAPMVQSGIWGPGKCSSLGLPAISKIVGQYLPQTRVAFYAGWFVETLPLLPPGIKFALVHLDCDLYESSIQVLDELFGNNRLADGCIVLFDDFLENRASKKLGQRKAWEECKAKYKPDLTELGFYCRASWRCIVHTDR